jgi:hypothetical protein
MRTLIGAILAMLLWLPHVHAESLRCNGAIATEGDSKLSVFYKCGQPTLSDSYCAPVYTPGSPYPVPAWIAGAYVPCRVVEEWLYDRGAGNLMAVVRFQDGRVQVIRYVRLPD